MGGRDMVRYGEATTLPPISVPRGRAPISPSRAVKRPRARARAFRFWPVACAECSRRHAPREEGPALRAWSVRAGPSCRARRRDLCPLFFPTPSTTLSSLDAAVVTRRRRRVSTSFAFPSGGAPTGASLHLDRLPLQRRRPRLRAMLRVCRLRRLRPALPASSPKMCGERRATGLPTPIARTAAPAQVPPGPGRQHVGLDHRLMCDVHVTPMHVVTKVYMTEST